ncbi:MAG TPA: winged helix-turn-helix domain-containing protein [Vicinamibacterales bacterium]|nr:winged helix-turn-helix domain-containing protein [Vicinamibacterales bacterium]
MINASRIQPSPRQLFRFGRFEVDVEAAELRRDGRHVKLQPQPFKLLLLVVRRAGAVVTRDEIRTELWPDGTFVDFDQAVNFAIKQIRDALGDSAEQSLYIQTVPKRGYRFIAPVEPLASTLQTERKPHLHMSGTAVGLQKALWANIAELRMAQQRHRRLTLIAVVVAAAVVVSGVIGFFMMRR